MPRRRRTLVAGWAAAVVCTVACGCTHAKPAGAAELSPTWTTVTLPAPDGTVPALGDVIACGGRFYAVGALRSGNFRRPAAWTSVDGRMWTTVPVAPAAIYGEVSLLYAAGCRESAEGEQLGAIGSASGGAHGNPRVGTWTTSDGVLRENIAAFELYGGPRALSVDRIAGGPLGWIVTGGRTAPNGRASAAVWPSADGRDFRLVDNDPALVSGNGELTRLGEAAAARGGWTAVGSRTVLGGGEISQQPIVWQSADGVHWRRARVPTGSGDESLERVVPTGNAALAAAGTRDGRFVYWRDDGNWHRVAEFGSEPDDATGVPAVRSLSSDGAEVALAGSDGARLTVWASTDRGAGWRPVRTPFRIPATGDTRIAVAVHSGRIVMADDDGRRGEVRTARLS